MAAAQKAPWIICLVARSFQGMPTATSLAVHAGTSTATSMSSCGAVTGATGGGVAWNGPVTMAEGIYINPGDRVYTFANVPDYLIGGQYVGSRVWPQGTGWTWSISYTPPVKLYIWRGWYWNAGIDSILVANGFLKEPEPNVNGWFHRNYAGAVANGNNFSVYSKDFSSGTSVDISGLNGLLVGGAVSMCPQASAVGDPHLQNVHGQKFDLMKPGKHVLINIPRGQSAEQALLHVQADARNLGGHCADMYFQELNVTGVWAEAKQTGGYHYSISAGSADTPEWVAFGGKVELKVVHGRTNSGLKYLNFYVKHLGQAGFAVGGLLGDDDHSDVVIPPETCVRRMSLMGGALSQSRSVVSSAVASFA